MLKSNTGGRSLGCVLLEPAAKQGTDSQVGGQLGDRDRHTCQVLQGLDPEGWGGEGLVPSGVPLVPFRQCLGVAGASCHGQCEQQLAVALGVLFPPSIPKSYPVRACAQSLPSFSPGL